MKSPVLAVVTLAVCIPAFAQEIATAREGAKPAIFDVNIPFAEAMHKAVGRPAAERLNPTPNVVLEGAEWAFIFPVAGSAGAFRTETVLMNRLNRTQHIYLYYLPIAGGSANCNKPGRAMDLGPNQMYLFTDFVPDVFGEGGFGSVIVLGVDAFGNNDTSARIDGNSRIWALAAGGGTASQNFPSMSVNVPAGSQSAFGLRHDEFYRTNWGIFNYDVTTRRYDIVFNGFRGSSQITTDIPPCSLIQQAVPTGIYGSLEIAFSPRDGGGLYYAYGSTVDRVSTDSYSVPARH
jgi:hypothetical protein